MLPIRRFTGVPVTLGCVCWRPDPPQCGQIDLRAPTLVACFLALAHGAEQNENERQGEERAMTKTSAQTSRTVDLVQLINQLDIRRFHFQLLALCAGVVFMDGFDAQAI